jgi:hypothetical protein
MLNEKDMSKRRKPSMMEYTDLIRIISKWPSCDFDYFPLVIPDWDNSARAGLKSFIIKGSTPSLWLSHLQAAKEYVKRYDAQKQLVFIKSWNEWAEGNYLEPDQKWGTKYLEILSTLK